MEKIESAKEAEQIPAHRFAIGFNKVYETNDEEIVSVPNHYHVPEDWKLIQD